MTRGIAAAVLGALLAGCATVTRMEEAAPAPAVPGDLGGPMLVFEISNRSALDVDLTSSFSAADGSSSGEGMGTFAACEAGTMPFGLVLGDFDVAVDGATVFQGTVPMAAADGFVILRLAIDEDGDVVAAGPRWTAVEPIHRSVPIPGCG